MSTGFWSEISIQENIGHETIACNAPCVIVISFSVSGGLFTEKDLQCFQLSDQIIFWFGVKN